MVSLNVEFKGKDEIVLKRLKVLKAKVEAKTWPEFFRVVANRLERVKGGSQAE